MMKFFYLSLCVLFFACNNAKTDDAAAEPSAATEMAPVEFADAKYIEIGKAGLAAMTENDIPKWMESYADNAIYRWNSGDSLAGKAAISEYWTNRRNNDIETITFANDLWLPVKVNTPANELQAPGVWLLGWYQVTAKYKNGQTMTQWIHNDMHFDADDKIDITIQYLDRAPINAAMSAK